jgi:hypothetical protein
LSASPAPASLTTMSAAAVPLPSQQQQEYEEAMYELAYMYGDSKCTSAIGMDPYAPAVLTPNAAVAVDGYDTPTPGSYYDHDPQGSVAAVTVAVGPSEGSKTTRKKKKRGPNAPKMSVSCAFACAWRVVSPVISPLSPSRSLSLVRCAA